MSQISSPSNEKVWMKYFSEESRNAEFPRMKVYSYFKEINKHRPYGTALYYYGKKITIKQMLGTIGECSNALAAIGVKKGDTVSIVSASTPESICLFYALNKIGATMNAIDPRLDKKSVARMIKGSGSKVLFVIDVAFPLVSAIMSEINQEHKQLKNIKT